MTALESQLQASIDIIELRKRDSATLAAVIKAAQAELQARKDQLRKDAVELQKRRKVLQKQAAELSRAGYRVAPRAERKDKGAKRAPRPSVRLVPAEDWNLCFDTEPVKVGSDVAELNALDKAADDAECADADARDDYERQNAARGNEP